MATTGNQTNGETGLPSRTSILVAAARAFASRDPDEGVRNPDWAADRLIGPDELALIGDTPIAKALTQEYAEAIQIPAVAFFAAAMIARTRFIDEALLRAVQNGAAQIVILGAGFDSRAYRFRELLKDCRVFEVDAEATQTCKKRRVHVALGDAPENLSYVQVDFAKDDVSQLLQEGGYQQGAKSFFVWEGVCMYLPEESVRATLQMIRSHSAPGSSVVLDYANRLGIDSGAMTPNGASLIPAAWKEPWIFGVPDANGSEFFRELGFDPGTPLSFSDPETYKRFPRRSDGSGYPAQAMQKMREQAQAQSQAGTTPSIPEKVAEAQRAIAAAGGAYWLAELTVLGAS